MSSPLRSEPAVVPPGTLKKDSHISRVAQQFRAFERKILDRPNTVSGRGAMWDRFLVSCRPWGLILSSNCCNRNILRAVFGNSMFGPFSLAVPPGAHKKEQHYPNGQLPTILAKPDPKSCSRGCLLPPRPFGPGASDANRGRGGLRPPPIWGPQLALVAIGRGGV